MTLANFHNSWPLPSSIGSFFTTIHWQVWQIFKPSPPKKCQRLLNGWSLCHMSWTMAYITMVFHFIFWNMGWLELMIETPSVDILHRSDCTWLCCLLRQLLTLQSQIISGRWANFCGLLRISELCYFYSVIEQMFQKVFYSGLADHKKHCKYFQLYEPSFSKKYSFLKIKLVSTYLDKQQT